MARPIKQGIDYFPMNVDFLRDIKVRKIMRAHGSQSVSILISLLGNIYKDNGYYIGWDEDLPFLIADEVGVSEGAVTETISKAVQVGFFEKNVFDKHKIITSRGIQKRFLEAIRLRKEVTIDAKFWLLEVNNNINLVFNNINSINNSESTQSKVKYSKEENSNNNSESKIDLKLMFDEFRKAYRGSKRGLELEFNNLQKKRKHDWREVVPLLMPALERLIAWREQAERVGKFVPEWAMLQTWINQSRWEIELETIKKDENGAGKAGGNPQKNEAGAPNYNQEF